ncbi:hypothetical protein F5B21DRAFT_480537 [Xylaria acuta]|nr:hypothetical protein F5B21DRAFT_480537 [Xylaria acuta]
MLVESYKDTCILPAAAAGFLFLFLSSLVADCTRVFPQGEEEGTQTGLFRLVVPNPHAAGSKTKPSAHLLSCVSHPRTHPHPHPDPASAHWNNTSFTTVPDAV